MINDQPLVSVIVPCYQAAKTVASTLDDIFSQTYPRLEVIVVNDGSTDATLEILKKYQPKIKIINQQNRGAAAARNRGFAASGGEYLLFCDADVRLRRDMVEKMLETLQKNPDKAYCYSNFKFGPHTFDLFPFDAARLKRENYVSTMSLIRWSRFLGFNEQLKQFQDWDLWKRLLNQGYEGAWCPERLFETPLGRGISRWRLKNLLTLIKRRIFGYR